MSYKKIKKKSSNIENQEPWKAVKMKMFEVPNPFPDELSKEKRLEALRNIGKNAHDNFSKKFLELEKWFKEFDSLYLLSFCHYYFNATPEGIDLEATGDLEFYHHYLEILQALSLTQDRNIDAKPLLEKAKTLYKEILDVGELLKMKEFNIPENINTDEELEIYILRSAMKTHTLAIRNWAYIHQMKKIVFDLSKLISVDFEKIYGIKPIILFELLEKLTDEREDLLNEHKKKIRYFITKPTYKEMIQAYNETYADVKNIEGTVVNEVWNRSGKNIKNLMTMLMCHSDLRIEEIYSFSLKHAHELVGEKVDIRVLQYAFSKISLSFGELRDFNREHIILSNPVLRKPFIDLGDGNYFSAVWGIMPHLMLDMLENLIFENKELKDKYSNKLKGEYLENRVKELFTKSFPNALIYGGSKWHDSKTGKDYENDLIVIIDRFAIVIEAKSGSISDPAKRGAPGRLFKTLKELIEEPSEQALRFIDYLQNKKQIHSFYTKKGEINKIDNTKIKYYVPLGVTLSNLGSIGCNLKRMIDAKVVNKKIEELIPSINLTDLESIFDILETEAEKIHYLARRREIEAHFIYEGDEMDLLAFYLDNGFNLGEDEYSQNLFLGILLKSKELDPYLHGSKLGIKVEKPQLAMTKWWKDLITTFSVKKFNGWLEASYVLLNISIEQQKEFERRYIDLVNKIKKENSLNTYDWLLFKSSPLRRSFSVIAYPYIISDIKTITQDLVFMVDEELKKGSRGVVIIGVDLNKNSYPYTVIAKEVSLDLFDITALSEIQS